MIVLSPVPSLYEVHALGALDAVGVVDEVRDGGGLEDLGERGEVVGRARREAGRRRQQAQNVVLLKRLRDGGGDIRAGTRCWVLGFSMFSSPRLSQMDSAKPLVLI